MRFLHSIKLSGFLSFPPDSPETELTSLNVLIGPNASGKSNLIEALELLHATPTKFAAAIRDGGGVFEWLWKGDKKGDQHAVIEVVLAGEGAIPNLRYRLSFAASGQRIEVVDEVIEEPEKRFHHEDDVYFFYRYQGGRPVINAYQTTTTTTPPPLGSSPPPPDQRAFRQLTRDSLLPDESVLSQRRDPELYPELTWLGRKFERIQSFREWCFGRYVALRQPQPTDLPADILMPNSRNLGLILNEIEHSGESVEYNHLLSRFLPRYERFSTRIHGGAVQIYLHESGLGAPVPATRLSDGTMRFMAMLALLLSPSPPPMICMEEPELGLHPDAVTLLAGLLVRASERTQLVVTTHSDALVSALTDHAGSVLVCENLGGTQLNRVDPEELKFWMDQYRLGEIWRIGELGGNP